MFLVLLLQNLFSKCKTEDCRVMVHFDLKWKVRRRAGRSRWTLADVPTPRDTETNNCKGAPTEVI